MGGSQYLVVVDAEHVVAAELLPLVQPLPEVRHLESDELALVLQHEVALADGLVGEDAPGVDAAAAEAVLALAGLAPQGEGERLAP